MGWIASSLPSVSSPLLVRKKGVIIFIAPQRGGTDRYVSLMPQAEIQATGSSFQRVSCHTIFPRLGKNISAVP